MVFVCCLGGLCGCLACDVYVGFVGVLCSVGLLVLFGWLDVWLVVFV